MVFFKLHSTWQVLFYGRYQNWQWTRVIFIKKAKTKTERTKRKRKNKKQNKKKNKNKNPKIFIFLPHLYTSGWFFIWIYHSAIRVLVNVICLLSAVLFPPCLLIAQMFIMRRYIPSTFSFLSIFLFSLSFSFLCLLLSALFFLFFYLYISSDAYRNEITNILKKSLGK